LRYQFKFCVSCKNGKKQEPATAVTKKIDYKDFKDSIIKSDSGLSDQTSNLFDEDVFIPGRDSLNKLLVNVDTLMHRQVTLIEYLDTLRARVQKTPGYTKEEKEAIKENMRVLDSFLTAQPKADTNLCKGKDCILFAEIDKSRQMMYLYLLGELKDSFVVSTGKGRRETPNFDMRPEGPVLTRYSSRRFPGGNYMRLGNMPYAVFIHNGYAIHGTTVNNFPKLGTRASKGCIRVHPDNAKVYNSLVKTVGLEQTWIRIVDSIPR
jgi:hypothetical protein